MKAARIPVIGSVFKSAFSITSSTENGLYIVNASGAGFSCVNMNSLTTNTWYHVVYVDNNGTGQLYLNNIQQSTATGGLNIGTGLTAINPNLNALPDNVMVGDRDDGYKSVSVRWN